MQYNQRLLYKVVSLSSVKGVTIKNDSSYFLRIHLSIHSPNDSSITKSPEIEGSIIHQGVDEIHISNHIRCICVCKIILVLILTTRNSCLHTKNINHLFEISCGDRIASQFNITEQRKSCIVVCLESLTIVTACQML